MMQPSTGAPSVSALAHRELLFSSGRRTAQVNRGFWWVGAQRGTRWPHGTLDGHWVEEDRARSSTAAGRRRRRADDEPGRPVLTAARAALAAALALPLPPPEEEEEKPGGTPARPGRPQAAGGRPPAKQQAEAAREIKGFFVVGRLGADAGRAFQRQDAKPG
ncbi:hypothetical protein GQ55_3G440500 [Panicum hallii var. hallii]|uniref:Uncharacterized protein n=1 Tax=Panicum hallii var. hallii TaxID=1504633 RepID=A0A2T7EI47_9POAL|nr:hypothetical protein GQ55_3G440500 [Panicum hallii var. hallii]